MKEEAVWRSLLSSPDAVRGLGAGLYTALADESGPAPYDRRAALYDAVVRWPIYHRLVWGASASEYRRFSKAALDAAGHGCFAEVGCGSLLFTTRMYANPRPQSSVLVDRSVQMLRRAVKRLAGKQGTLPRGVVALHADGATLPFRSAVFSSILCLNLLHVACDRQALVAEFGRTLAPGGRLFVSSLVRCGRWSDAYLSFLHRAGEFGIPLTHAKLAETVAGGWGQVESTRVEGNMAYLIVRHTR